MNLGSRVLLLSLFVKGLEVQVAGDLGTPFKCTRKELRCCNPEVSSSIVSRVCPSLDVHLKRRAFGTLSCGCGLVPGYLASSLPPTLPTPMLPDTWAHDSCKLLGAAKGFNSCEPDHVTRRKVPGHQCTLPVRQNKNLSGGFFRVKAYVEATLPRGWVQIWTVGSAWEPRPF